MRDVAWHVQKPHTFFSINGIRSLEHATFLFGRSSYDPVLKMKSGTGSGEGLDKEHFMRCLTGEARWPPGSY